MASLLPEGVRCGKDYASERSCRFWAAWPAFGRRPSSVWRLKEAMAGPKQEEMALGNAANGHSSGRFAVEGELPWVVKGG